MSLPYLIKTQKGDIVLLNNIKRIYVANQTILAEYSKEDDSIVLGRFLTESRCYEELEEMCNLFMSGNAIYFIKKS